MPKVRQFRDAGRVNELFESYVNDDIPIDLHIPDSNTIGSD